MATQMKYSHQREAILNFLRTRLDHPTAEVVYANIRQEIPNISLGTVYRNLNNLANNGTIQRLTYGGKTDHFDANVMPHYHFMCNICGSVQDVHMSTHESLIKDACNCIHANIDSVSVFFSGTCENCIS